jgi:hypothetical protein
MPEAANCWVTPEGILELTGVTETEDRVADVTVRAVSPVTLVLPKFGPEVAVMVAMPGAMAVAKPLLLTVATVLDEVQVTCVVIS